MSLTVTVLARAPEPGRAKTRLAAVIGTERAARLCHALALDVVESLVLWDGGAVTVALDGSELALAAFAADIQALGASVEAQGGGDLGHRMEAAVGRRWTEGSRRILVVGSDCPDVAGRLAETCAGRLEAPGDAVLAPARDGGFVLLGCAMPIAGALAGIAWSSPGALIETRKALAAAGCRVSLGPSAEDIDDAASLRRLGKRLRRRPTLAPRTAELLGGWAELDDGDAAGPMYDPVG